PPPAARRARLVVPATGPATLRARLVDFQRQSAAGTAMCFLERDRDFGLEVLPAHAVGCAPCASASPAAPSPGKQRFEKVAEIPATEPRIVGVAGAVSKIGARWLPTRRRAEFGATFPIRAQLVVALSVLRIGKNFVRLLDVLDLRPGLLAARIQIGMMLPH